MSGVQHIEIADQDAGARLDRWFKRQFPHIAHGRVEKLMRTGQVRIDGKRVKGNARLAAGQTVRVPPLPEPGEAPPSARISQVDTDFMRSLVLYEDETAIALNKPAGLAVQGGSKTARHIDGLLNVFGDGPAKPRLVHRLDRDTSGVLVVAKSAASAKDLARAFQSRRTGKLYVGITNGVPRPLEGEIKGFIGKGETLAGREIMQAVSHGTDGAKHALSEYKTLSQAGKRAALIALKPHSGRKHQLRLHMQLLGTPFVGDPKYLTDREPPGGLDDNLFLHAYRLTIPMANGRTLDVKAPLPPHFERAMTVLGFDPNMSRHDLDFSKP